MIQSEMIGKEQELNLLLSYCRRETMDTLNNLTTILGNGFFPIIVCGVLFWYVWKKDAQHKAEMDEIRKSVDNNTNVLEKLVTAVDRILER